jgi:hypothetical protein
MRYGIFLPGEALIFVDRQGFRCNLCASLASKTLYEMCYEKCRISNAPANLSRQVRRNRRPYLEHRQLDTQRVARNSAKNSIFSAIAGMYRQPRRTYTGCDLIVGLCNPLAAN